ncbi:MAG TPA: hypothetical protein VLF43_00365 [Candidatus Saccharimonadales bacterium]|nr:hypothetical protein [Candidatus Saccharimonadales bacterium]
METAELRANQLQDPFGLNQAALFNAVEDVFAPKDFSAVNEAAFGDVTVSPFGIPEANVAAGDFRVTAPTVAEAEAMRLEASVQGVGKLAVADYMDRQVQLAAIAEAEAIVRNAFLKSTEATSDDEELVNA